MSVARPPLPLDAAATPGAPDPTAATPTAGAPEAQDARADGRCKRCDKLRTAPVETAGDTDRAAENSAWAPKTSAVSSTAALEAAMLPAAGGAPPTRAIAAPASGKSGTRVIAPLKSRATNIDIREYSETPGIGRLVKKWSTTRNTSSSFCTRTAAVSTVPASQRAAAPMADGTGMARSVNATTPGSEPGNSGGRPTGLSMDIEQSSLREAALENRDPV